jgi:uncharacterized protein (UPF0335 family)
MTKINHHESKVRHYKDVYKEGHNAGISTFKMKLIQELIQIRRPTNWDQEKLESLIEDLVRVEKYNCIITHKEHKFENKWNFLNNK